MMSEGQTRKSKQSIEARIKLNERVSRVLEMVLFRDPGKWGGFEDVRLAIFGSDGFRTCIEGAWPIGAFFSHRSCCCEARWRRWT